MDMFSPRETAARQPKGVLESAQFDIASLRPLRSFSGNRVVVAGVFRNGTGLARAAELVALTLERRGSAVSRVDIGPVLGYGSHVPTAGFLSPRESQALPSTDVIIVAGPDRSPLELFDADWLKHRAVIAHWIWELDRIPQRWKARALAYDEVWACSDLLAETFRQGLGRTWPRKVSTLPFAIDLAPFAKTDPAHRKQSRSALRVDPRTFVVGYSFAAMSNFRRKNPLDAIRAFVKAFPEQADVALFLRSRDLADWPPARRALYDQISDDLRIRVFGDADAPAMADFYAAIDVYLSPSRAEGFGLNLVEAAQAGLPVITNGWRLAPEISALPGLTEVGFDLEPIGADPQGNYDCVPGAMWPRPRIDELAAALDRAYNSAQHTISIRMTRALSWRCRLPRLEDVVDNA